MHMIFYVLTYVYYVKVNSSLIKKLLSILNPMQKCLTFLHYNVSQRLIDSYQWLFVNCYYR